MPGICCCGQVVFVQGLPHDCTDDELRQLGTPFGTVIDALALHGQQKVRWGMIVVLGLTNRSDSFGSLGQGFIEMSTTEAATALINHYTSNPVLLRGGLPLSVAYSNRSNIVRPSTGHGASADASTPVLLVSFHNVVFPVTIPIIKQVRLSYVLWS